MNEPHDPTRTVDVRSAPADSLNVHSIASTGGDTSMALAAAPPATAPRYVLGDEIARGGMGVIYRATDSVLGREVAVKALQDKFAPGSGTARRFADEARITAQLQHPNIPAVHDLGTLPDGRPFLAMKLIRGDTLDDLLAARPDPGYDRGRFVAAFEQVCQALAYAHAHGIIHRDLKPANVMVGKFGEVQVMDWGLAKVLAGGQPADNGPERTVGGTSVVSLRDTDASFTQAGSVLGTPAFMPPEQAVGAIDKIGARADVFGLGAVLAVILTGKPPFAAASAETTRIQAAQGRVEECFARLDRCGVEPDLVALCKTCLAPDPAHRPSNAGEVARAVGQLRAAADERARRAEFDRVKAEGDKVAAELRAAAEQLKRRVQTALGLAFVALVVLGGAFAWWRDRQQAVADAELASQRERTDSSITLALSEARTRTDEAWREIEYPGRMRIATDFAIAAVRRAEGFANTGAPTPEVGSRLDAVRTAVTDLDRHTRLLVSADAALMYHAASSFHGSGTVERFGQAFREFGWDMGKVPPEAIADQIVANRIRDKVLGFLGDWSFQSSGAEKERVLKILRLARLKAGGHLARWQAILDRTDLPALVEFSTDAQSLNLGPELLGELGRNLDSAIHQEPRLQFLRRAVARYPTHVWLRYDLRNACLRVFPPLRYEALEHAAAATALRPESAMFQLELVTALERVGDRREAEAVFGRAINAFKEAIRLDPKNVRAHVQLAAALYRKGRFAEAEAAFREAVRADPDNGYIHDWLAFLRLWAGDPAGALPFAEKATKLSGESAQTYWNLGRAQAGVGDYQAAVASFRKALDIDPNHASARGSLAQAERLAAIQHKLPALLKGDFKPATNDERLALSELCRLKKLFRTSAGLCADAFAADPQLADNLKAPHRYNAACYAALAAAGRGEDAGKLDDQERARLRKQAIDWLRADLALRTKQLERGQPADRADVARRMRHWQRDSDLAGIRDEDALANLPADERAAVTQLWADVAVLLKKTE
jgi:tetratricopeptide (TPR) repeat protein